MYSEMVRQFKLYYICRNDLRDLERPYSFFGKFLVWSFDPKIFCFQPNIVAYFIFRCFRSIPVSKSFHRLLCITNGCFSFFMDTEHLVCEVRNADPFWPVYLSIMSEDPQERFNTLVLTFCLAICLRMVRRR